MTPAPLQLGILSDTHGLLRPRVLSELEGVDHILHAGDVGDPAILVELEAIAPVTAVWGNTDGFDIRSATSELARVELAGCPIVVTHGHMTGTTPKRLRQLFPEAELVVYGHTHQPLVETVRGAVFVNPGSCGPRRFNLPVCMARAELAPGDGPERIRVRPIDLDS